MSKTILFVDDDKLMRKFLSTKLEGNGYRVVQVDSGEEAISMGSPDFFDSIDIIVLDIEMPKLNGFVTSQRIRKMVTKPMPIIFFTGNVYTQETLGQYLTDQDQFITKPDAFDDGIINEFMGNIDSAFPKN